MTLKQRFCVALMILWSAVLVAMLVWMVVKGDYALWAAELAVLCLFAWALLGYAREWRRLRDEKEGGI